MRVVFASRGISFPSIAAAIALSAAGCGSSDAPPAGEATAAATTSPAASAEGETPATTASSSLPPADSQFVPSTVRAVDRTPTNRPTIVLRTDRGELTIELYRDAAPATVQNFLATYVENGLYTRTIFHHVDPGFIAIAGGYDESFRPVYAGDPVANESSSERPNLKGTIAMIHSPEDANSATSQFYLNLRDNPTLDAASPGEGYCVFGRVIKGLEVLDAIAATPTVATGEFEKMPSQAVTIASVEILRY